LIEEIERLRTRDPGTRPKGTRLLSHRFKEVGALERVVIVGNNIKIEGWYYYES
jgi:hypothetical protein